MIRKAAKDSEIFEVREGENSKDGSSSGLESAELLSPPLKTIIPKHTILIKNDDKTILFLLDFRVLEFESLSQKLIPSFFSIHPLGLLSPWRVQVSIGNLS